MNCEDVRGIVSERLDGGTPSGREAELREHLSACAECAAWADGAGQTEEWLAESLGRERLGDDFTEATMNYVLTAAEADTDSMNRSVWTAWALIAAAVLFAVLLLNAVFPGAGPGPDGDGADDNHGLVPDPAGEDAEDGGSSVVSRERFDALLGEAQALEAKLDKISMSVVDMEVMPIADVAHLLAGVTGIDILLTPDLADSGREVTLKLQEGISALRFLQVLEEVTGVVAQFREGRVILAAEYEDGGAAQFMQVYDVSRVNSDWLAIEQKRIESMAALDLSLSDAGGSMVIVDDAEGMSADDICELLFEMSPSYWDSDSGSSLEVRGNLIIARCGVVQHLRIRECLSMLLQRPKYTPGEDRGGRATGDFFSRMAKVKSPALEFQDMTPGGIFDALNDVAGVSFVVLPNADENNWTFTFGESTVASVLRELQRQMNVRLEVMPDAPSVVFVRLRDDVGQASLVTALFEVPVLNDEFEAEDCAELIQSYTGGDSWNSTDRVFVRTLPGYVMVRQIPEVLDEVVELLESLKNPVKMGE